MIHKSDALERHAKELETRADSELDPKKRAQLRLLAREKREEKRRWERPH